MYKVSFEDSILSFVPDEASCTGCHALPALPADGVDGITKVLENLEIYKRVCIKSAAPAETFARFSSWFTHAEAAGGVVRNSAGDALMIVRNNRWDLPKGHREAGEPLEVCALREVAEECGIGGVELRGLLTRTRHIYQLEGRWVMKLTAWYAMHSDDPHPVPQTAEGITDAVWVAAGEVAERVRLSYPTIRQVFDAENEKLKII